MVLLAASSSACRFAPSVPLDGGVSTLLFTNEGAGISEKRTVEILSGQTRKVSLKLAPGGR